MLSLVNGNFGYWSVDGNNVDTGIPFNVDTWYWIGIVRNGNNNTDIRIYNEAKDTLLWSRLGVGNRNNRTWSDGDSAVHIRARAVGANTYFDELTDEGTPAPPAAAAFMQTKKYR